MFICRSILIKNPEKFNLILAGIMLFYFTVIIRVVESGFQRDLRISDFGGDKN